MTTGDAYRKPLDRILLTITAVGVVDVASTLVMGWRPIPIAQWCMALAVAVWSYRAGWAARG